MLSGAVVTDEMTPQPVKRAQISLANAETGFVKLAYTDNAGRFAIPNLPAGRYMLSASKPGYVRAAYGAKRPDRPGTPITLADRQQMTGISLRMPRGGVIAGTITDETGVPAFGAQVRVLQYRVLNGERTLAPVTTASLMVTLPPVPRTARGAAFRQCRRRARSCGRRARPWTARLGAVAAAALPAGRISTEVIAAGCARSSTTGPSVHSGSTPSQLHTSLRVTFGRDPSPPADVASAVAASCAIPSFFAPVTINGVRYVDGGVHSPTNADLVAGLGLDLVVISSPMSVARNQLRFAPDQPARRLSRFALVREARESVAAARR